MNDSAPPHDGHTPQSWQNHGVGARPTAPQAPAFDPRRAVGGPAAHPPRRGSHPVMAPPPVLQDRVAPAAPSPYEAPPPYDAGSLYPGHQAPHIPQQAAPPYPRLQAGAPVAPVMALPNPGYRLGHYDQNYAGQPAYEYPQATVPTSIIEAAGGRASLLSRLMGLGKKSQSPDLYQVPEQDMAAAASKTRKPFLMGLLTGVVVMLILGQIFRASQPSADYAQALPLINMTVEDGPTSEDPEALAFLDTVEGLN